MRIAASHYRKRTALSRLHGRGENPNLFSAGGPSPRGSSRSALRVPGRGRPLGSSGHVRIAVSGLRRCRGCQEEPWGRGERKGSPRPYGPRSLRRGYDIRAPLVDLAVGVGRSPGAGWGGGRKFFLFYFFRSPETAKTSPQKIVRTKKKKSAGRRPGGGGTTRG